MNMGKRLLSLMSGAVFLIGAVLTILSLYTAESWARGLLGQAGFSLLFLGYVLLILAIFGKEKIKGFRSRPV